MRGRGVEFVQASKQLLDEFAGDPVSRELDVSSLPRGSYDVERAIAGWWKLNLVDSAPTFRSLRLRGHRAWLPWSSRIVAGIRFDDRRDPKSLSPTSARVDFFAPDWHSTPFRWPFGLQNLSLRRVSDKARYAVFLVIIGTACVTRLEAQSTDSAVKPVSRQEASRRLQAAAARMEDSTLEATRRELIIELHAPKRLERAALAKRVAIGMSPLLVRLAWGEPEEINVTTTAAGEREQWVYNSKTYVYVVNDRVTAIQYTK